MIQSDLCTFCQASQDTIEHLFFQYIYCTNCCNEFENYWLTVTKEQRKLKFDILY